LALTAVAGVAIVVAEFSVDVDAAAAEDRGDVEFEEVSPAQ
jgi:hypothetical protein